MASTIAEPPDGIVSAAPFRYRLDWAAGVFQVRIRNDSDAGFTVVGVQFVWDGFTTPVAERHDTIVPGLSLDFPVEFVGADVRRRRLARTTCRHCRLRSSG